MPTSNTQVSGSAIAFIDSQVTDYQSLIAGVTPGTEVVILDENRDAIDQITEVLALRSNIDSIHIISHGSPGSLQLGKTRLCSDNLETYAEKLQQWRSALTPRAEILIYGCNVALTSFTFIQRIAQLTNTKVAASKNLIGSAAKGGDWELEVTTGKIAASLAFRPEVLAAYSHVLSTFSEARNYSVGTPIADMGTGDFNGDGFFDLAVLNRNSRDISILLGTGSTGSFATPITLFNPGNESPSGVAVRDFNGDGKLDLAVANPGNGGFVSIRLGTGTGSFGNPTNFGQDINHSSIAAADFNGDGNLDLATIRNGDTFISILFGSGTGSFGTAVKINTQKLKYTVATADFNGDGKVDLVTSNRDDTDNISIFLGDGNGNFNSAVNLTARRGDHTVVTGDFNGDGKLDLAANNSTDQDVSVFLGDGTGNFGNATNFAVKFRPYSILAGDFNGDSKVDLATSNDFYTVSVLLGDGTGQFGNLSNFTTRSLRQSEASMAAADFNADGKLDIATAFSNNVSVLLNTSNTVNFGAATYSSVEGTTDTVVNIPVIITGGTPLNDVVVPIVLDPSSTATQNSDYTFSPTSITFPAGATGDALTQNIAVTIKSDSIKENAETAIFNLGTITGAMAGFTKQTTLTIADRGSVAYAIATNAATIEEGNSGKKPLTFTVTRSEDTSGASSVNYAIAGTATNVTDYNNIGGTSGARITTGTINFVTGEISKTITLDVLGDTVVEPDETITVTLSNPTGVAAAIPIITADTATTTIINYTAPTPISPPIPIPEAPTPTPPPRPIFTPIPGPIPPTPTPTPPTPTPTPPPTPTPTPPTPTPTPAPPLTPTPTPPPLTPTPTPTPEPPTPTPISPTPTPTPPTPTPTPPSPIPIPTPTPTPTPTDNRPPVVNISIWSQSGSRDFFQTGNTFTFDPNTYTDPDPGDSINYTIAIASKQPKFASQKDLNGVDYRKPIDGSSFDEIPLPSWLTFDPETRTINIGETRPKSFGYWLKITGTDSSGASVSEIVRFNSNNFSGFGFVIDNYIAGATVFLDANKNGILDPNEPSAITSPNGEFNLNLASNIFDKNENGEIDPEEGNIVAIGGTDTATGLPLETPVTAPPDATVVTLLTSLVADLIDKGVTSEQAQSSVKTSLGIPADIDLISFDPIKATNNNQPGGVQVLSAMVKVQNVITQTSALIDGASSALTKDIVKAVVSSLTTRIQSSTVLNLSNAADLEPIIQQSVSRIKQVDPTFNSQNFTQIASQAATVMATANQRIDSAVSSTTGTSIPEAVARVQKVSLGATSQDFKAVGAGSKPISQLVAENTGTALDTKIEAVTTPGGIATPVVTGDADFGSNSPDAILGTNDDDILTGGSENDVLMGMRGNDYLDGTSGNDSLFGGKGNDILLGGSGNDALFGSRGADILNGGDGNDILLGGKGDDLLTGGLGSDVLTGGNGNDKFLLSTNSGTDIITDFEVGKDLLVLGNGLTFSQLSVTQENSSTFIRLSATGEILASLNGVSASLINAANFNLA
ncbi:DUF4347 domain-containing protein [Microcoleus sp. LEGE 07076]|uniref:DUF4347 domain-containing protein n=1 Tax=Microcoleus sp. LEGE 07076 TaxID=915322 RepID=UPI00187ECF7C|nr:DUF4347 domain-containing protein [Microcoleus sp. LEGE 07076]MBE9187176.1 DUF4347 domain-containing protein [Microcoleus sp. LEGE 07076]